MLLKRELCNPFKNLNKSSEEAHKMPNSIKANTHTVSGVAGRKQVL